MLCAPFLNFADLHNFRLSKPAFYDTIFIPRKKGCCSTMDKRYQVFVSSTREDLDKERREVMQALLELDYIPAGMELFPSSNEDQWSLIKRIIDDSDYFIVVIAGRYGATNDKGMSYTEMEYRYALKTGKPILAFLHRCPEEIKAAFTEDTQEGREKLEEFRNLAKKKLVRFWTDPSELGRMVSQSLIKLQKQFPSTGWVRADSVGGTDAAQELFRLKRENRELRKRISALEEVDALRSEFGLLNHTPSLQHAKEFGICAIAKGRADDALLDQKIEHAKHVKVLHTTGLGFFQTHVQQLTRMLRNHGTLQILLPNPYSDFLEDVGHLEVRGPGNPISSEFDVTMDNIRSIWEQAHATPCDTIGKIEIGCAHTLLRQTEIICIDKEDETADDDQQIWCWVTMTMPPFRAGADSVSFECQTAKGAESGDLSLAGMTNDSFNCIWKTSNPIEFHGQDVPYFYKETSHAVTFWKKKLDDAKEFTLQAQNDSKRTGVLIEVAAQHPLQPDGTPGVEFARRLDMGYQLYREYQKKKIRCKLYVPGSLHMYQGKADQVSLSEAGQTYLITRKKVSPDDIYGEEKNVMYRGTDGVYNSADECFVASQIWKDEGFSELVCVCSPVQSMRKTAHYIALGVFPSVFTCPSPELFHDYVHEMFTALPHVLYEDPDLDPAESNLAKEHRMNRKPGFSDAQNHAE